MNRLDDIIAHQLPGNATQIARKTKRAYNSALRSLQRMEREGLIYRDDEKVYHWHPAKPLPEKPAELKEEKPVQEAWVKFIEAAWAGEPDKYQETDFDTMVEYVNKHLITAARVAFYSRLILEAQSEGKLN